MGSILWLNRNNASGMEGGAAVQISTEEASGLVMMPTLSKQ